ncbi:DUF5672 family protein [Mucilaginibacter calamicampi]|uniref:DUF5672 family protein n=1 Tax=Mucilaginibacter calamicampi TaxID=1302352 RepID=A0ABW2YZX5_9SPHI
MVNRVCVVIPVHKQHPTNAEVLSLRACTRHLASYDCYLIFPQDLDVSAYTTIFKSLLPRPVTPQWLASIEAYNKMKLDLRFYNMFSAYTHMLTYELDAYIFSDKLNQAHAFEFDFIGAPFFEGYWEAKPDAQLVQGCNSGFSVRNIQSCISVLSSMNKYRKHWIFYKLFLSPSRHIRLWLNRLTNNRYEVFITGRFAFYFDGFHLNEDVVWTEVVPKLFPNFSIADGRSALQFAFEYNLPQSLQLNGGNLPLGCHAWPKHPEFWKEYINFDNLT